MGKGRISRKEIILKGIPTSPGIALGKTLFFGRKVLKPEKKIVSEYAIEAELERLQVALETTRKSMEKTRDKAIMELGEIVGRIFDSHLLILEDEILLEEIKEKIRQEHLSADYAFYMVMSKTYNSLIAQQKDYFRERADDIRDVGMRIIMNLAGKGDKLELPTGEAVIIAAHLITPSEIVHLERSTLLGVMTDIGGITSHTAILTRALEVPAVVGLKKVMLYAETVESSVINGNSGKVILNPTPAHQEIYQQKQERYLQFRKNLSNLRNLPAETIDCHRIKLMANIEFPHEIDTALNHGAEGIGLFRTEYLYLLNNHFPSEEEQFNQYRRLVEKMSPHPVTIRTFDLGGDKAPRGLEIGREANPVMGLRAIRISLARPELFKDQIRAILRASAFGKVRIMFPLVIDITEIRKILYILAEVKEDLRSNGIPFDESLQVGIMIEVPSAVMMAPELAKEVDFFSLGTNDLIQFSLAADRGNEMVAHLFHNLHPSIIRLINMTVAAGHAQKIEVGMCGEMAGDLLATIVLLGLGLDSLSASPVSLLEIKKIIRSIRFSEAQKFAQKILTCKTYEEIHRMTVRTMKERFAELPIWFSAKDNYHKLG